MRAFALLAVALLALPGAADPDLYAHKGIAIRGADPVAYFSRGAGEDAVLGSEDISVEYGGATWRFANEANRAAFVEDPTSYLPQYGGYCAYAIALGSTQRIDPDAWHITDGKLYLNYSKRIARKWLRERDDYIAQADQNWPELNRDCVASGGCSK